MEAIRAITSTGLFIGGLYLMLDGVTATPLSWALVGLSVGALVLAYAVWPSKRRGHRDSDHPLWDMLEFVIELPVEVIIWLVRLLGRLLTGKSGGVDIDF